MSQQWTQIKVSGKHEDLDNITAVMSMISNGLSIEDYSDLPTDGMYGTLIDDALLNADKTRISVSVYIPPEQSLPEAMAFLRERLAFCGITADIDTVGVREEDWAESWKKYYTVQKIGPVVIVPAWEKYTPEAGETAIWLDPGMAFGTGTHETTRLILRMLPEVVKSSSRMLDIGCGSGILSICASKLGAAHCDACDLDPVAVRVASENIEKSDCRNVDCFVSDLLSGVKRPDGKSVPGYNIIAANIVADILARLTPAVGDYLAEDGVYILSGIIAPSEKDVRRSLAENGFIVKRALYENDWCALLAVRG